MPSIPSGHDLAKIKHAHFVGIGGIGISAVARMMLAEGKMVSGSDISDSLVIDELRKLGASIFIGHDAKNVAQTVDMLVYSPAILEDNPELKAARSRSVPLLSYPETLNIISSKRYTIAVSGTHGKTTTTAMIAKLLVDEKLKPTVIVGSLIKIPERSRKDVTKDSGIKSNFIAGEVNDVDGRDYFVVEACEYRRSFLQIQPRILVITNIDNDHLDYYKNMKGIQKAFSEMVAKLGEGDEHGFLVCDPNSPTVKPVIKTAKHVGCKIVDYTKFRSQARKLALKVPGKHNKENAAAVLAVAKILDIDKGRAGVSLEGYAGTWRRFEYKGKTEKRGSLKSGILIYDDYGHHPTEIKATISGAKDLYPDRKIAVVFQPHLYSRTKDHLKAFGRCFTSADAVILLPIYAARESYDSSISSEMVVAEIKKSKSSKYSSYAKDLDEAVRHLNSIGLESGSVVLFVGAGDVCLMSEAILSKK